MRTNQASTHQNVLRIITRSLKSYSQRRRDCSSLQLWHYTQYGPANSVHTVPSTSDNHSSAPCLLSQRSPIFWHQGPIFWKTVFTQTWSGVGRGGDISGCFTRVTFIRHFVSVQLLSYTRFSATPWTVACQAPLPMGFSRQEYWSGLPLLPSGDHPDPGSNPALASRSFIIKPPVRPLNLSLSLFCTCIHLYHLEISHKRDHTVSHKALLHSWLP